MKIIKKILVASDLFKTPIALLFHSHPKISTSPGIILSLLIYIFLFVSFLNSDFFLRKNPNISDGSIANQNTQIILNNNNFGIIFSLLNENNIDYEDFDPSYINIEAQIINSVNKTSHIIKSLELLNYTKNKNDSQRIFPKGLILRDDLQIDLNLTKEYGWNSHYSLLSFKINICDNDTSPVACKPLDTILDYIHGKYFYISFLEYFYDLNDFENPAKISTENLRFIQLNKNIYNLMSFSFMEVGLYQDKSFYFDEGEEQFSRSYQQDPAQFFSSFSTFDKNDLVSKNISKIGEYLFWPSLNKRKIIRKYQKMPEAFSQIGGLLTFFKVFGLMFCSLTKHLKILQSLSEKFYQNIEDFENEDRVKRKSYDQDSIAVEQRSLPINSFPCSHTIEMFTRNKRDLETDEKNENLPLNNPEKIELKIPTHHVKKKFKVTLFKYLKFVFYQCFKLKQNDDLKTMKILESIYMKKFDFINILKIMNEVEKIKCFLFDSKQMNFKSNLKKENIFYSNNTNDEIIKNIIKSRKKGETEQKFIELYKMNIETH